MPLSMSECKHEILHTYHKNIHFWHTLLGRMFEATNGFTKSAEIQCVMNEIQYVIAWTLYDYSWHIDETVTEMEMQEVHNDTQYDYWSDPVGDNRKDNYSEFNADD